jgi:UDP-N-acetylmuramoylalanine--D-glutamate ligase
MKIAIVGFGAQGRSAYEYWRAGNSITVCDKNEDLQLPADVTPKLGADHLKHLDQFDLIVRSPVVHPSDIAAANTPEILEKVTTVTNQFFKVSPTTNIIGVTGTKGKGTTSTLITKMLEATGRRVHLGGNIGIPPLDLLQNDIQPTDWVVLELANFQLIDLNHSPNIAVCLMVVPEHLDWHTDVKEYFESKRQLFAHQTAKDLAVYYADNDNSEHIASAGNGHKMPYGTAPGAFVKNGIIGIDQRGICKTTELKLLGEHNWQNVCAALTVVWQIAPDVEALRSALTSFTGLPFRLELRREVHDIRYYNDSFAAAPPAPAAALQAIAGSKVMIIGGFDRNLDLTDLAAALKAHSKDIRHVLLIGASGQRTAYELEDEGFNKYTVSQAKTMKEIVAEATALAKPGDAVVLSPGFPSFDMFKNFEDRGEQYNAAVEQL